MAKSKRPDTFLLLIAFISGMAVMAVEMSASRLLAPYFGTSLFVWTNIIGIVMVALTIGYRYGGKLADRRPDKKLLCMILVAAGIYITLIPFIAQPVMQLSIKGITEKSISIFYSSLLATIVLFAPPLVVLGMTSPFVIRILAKEIRNMGKTSGDVYAISTLGSIIGTFIPALLTIPFIGTKKTIILFGVLLILFAGYGLWKTKAVAAAALFTLLLLVAPATLKASPGMLVEDESVYNYIQVVQDGKYTELKLNEGQAVHSMYDPDSVLVNGVWDYFTYFPALQQNSTDALIIGIAAGTISRSYAHYYPALHVDGVEIDGRIVDLGKQYFDMEQRTLTTHIYDGRTYLGITSKNYDLVIIDAYKQPYIPFHLTTKEFFTEVRQHLKQGGIVAINVGATSPNSDILNMIANTMAAVYKHVWIIPIEHSFNFVVFASDGDYTFDAVQPAEGLSSLFTAIRLAVAPYTFDSRTLVLTDDKAPVEIMTDKMILQYAEQ